MNNFTVPI
jgi:hypothetical protein